MTTTDAMQVKEALAEHRPCPTCGDFDLVLIPDEPVDGWNELSCKTCKRVLEIGRPGIGPLVDPLWVERNTRALSQPAPTGKPEPVAWRWRHRLSEQWHYGPEAPTRSDTIHAYPVDTHRYPC